MSDDAAAGGAGPLLVTVACTFDPLGLCGPLQLWLQQLAGLPIQLRWVGYGSVRQRVA